MMNSKLMNAVWVVVLMFVSLTYLSLAANNIPGKYALVINFILVPLVLGVTGYFLLQGTLAVKLILLAILPIVHVLYFGADEAKPGLENMVAVGEYLFICVGTVLSHLARKYLRHT